MMKDKNKKVCINCKWCFVDNVFLLKHGVQEMHCYMNNTPKGCNPFTYHCSEFMYKSENKEKSAE